MAKRTFSQEALDIFNTALLDVNWSDVLDCTCPNLSYDLFYAKFKTIYDHCFPEKIIKLSSKSIRNPHITSALKKSIKEKHRLEKLAYKWPLTYRNRYKAYRNKLTSLLKEAKIAYYQDQLIANRGNSKSHWKSINNILGRSTDGKNIEIDLKPISLNKIPN